LPNPEVVDIIAAIDKMTFATYPSHSPEKRVTCLSRCCMTIVCKPWYLI